MAGKIRCISCFSVNLDPIWNTIYINCFRCKNSIWKYAINKVSVYLYPAYKISVKCSQNLTEQGSGCILLQDDKKNDVGNYFF